LSLSEANIEAARRVEAEADRRFKKWPARLLDHSHTSAYLNDMNESQFPSLMDKPSLPRFMIRQGNRGLMVWDRRRKGPAMYNGSQAIGLTQYQANEIKDQLTRYHAE
jgi:hypothetical protein